MWRRFNTITSLCIFSAVQAKASEANSTQTTTHYVTSKRLQETLDRSFRSWPYWAMNLQSRLTLIWLLKGRPAIPILKLYWLILYELSMRRRRTVPGKEDRFHMFRIGWKATLLQLYLPFSKLSVFKQLETTWVWLLVLGQQRTLATFWPRRPTEQKYLHLWA